MGRDPAEDARDAAAEVFVIAFRRRADFELSRASARPWLFGIAANLIHSNRRSERRRLRALARLDIPLEPDHADEAISRANADLARPALVKALLGLRREERELLLQWSWAGLTYSELSEALDIPIGTIRSRLARARTHVRELLGAEGQELAGPHEEGGHHE